MDIRQKGIILVVDDEPIILTALKKEIEDSGYQCRVAASGQEAVEIVKKEKIDIVYLDLVMPELDGVETCKQILAVSPGTEVVLLSGAPQEIQQKQPFFLEAGGRDELLRKPLENGEIAAVTKKIFEEKEQGI